MKRMELAVVACLAATLGFGAGTYETPERLRFPYISHYRVKPQVTTGEKVTIGYYVTDWDHRKVRFGDTSERFDVTLAWSPADDCERWTTLEQKDVPSGDGEFDLGTFKPGEYIVSLKCRDRRGLESRTLWMDFLCVTPESLVIPANEIATPSAADLAAAGIRIEAEDYYGYVPVEIGKMRIPTNYKTLGEFEKTGEDEKVAQEIAAKIDAFIATDEGQAAIARHSEGYTVFIPAQEGEYIFRAHRHCRLVPGAKYDADAEEARALATSDALEAYFNKLADAGFRKVVLPKGTYRLSCRRTVNLPGRFTVDLNGSVLKMNRFCGLDALALAMCDVSDAHVTNGTLEGNLYEFDFRNCGEENPEHVSFFRMHGDCRRCSFSKVSFRYTTGGCWNCSSADKKPFWHPGAFKWELQAYEGKAKGKGKGKAKGKGRRLEWEPDGEGRFKSPYLTMGGLASNRYMTVAKFLGYQGVATKSWYYGIEFFDAEKRLLRAETGYQYHHVLVPKSAHFFRVSLELENLADTEKLRVKAYWLRAASGGEMRDCTFDRCRTCAFGTYQSYNMLFENLEIRKSGDESCMCAFDAEDGWDGMQNITFRNIRCADNPNGDFKVLCGHDFTFEKCRMRIWLAPRAQSTLLRDCDFDCARLDCTWKTRGMYTRAENCRFGSQLILGMDENRRRKDFDWEIVLDNAELKGTPEKPFDLSLRQTGRLRNCRLENIMESSAVATRDIAFLRTAYHLPPAAKEGKVGAHLVFSPYKVAEKIADGVKARADRGGYARVQVDCRGMGGSEGRFIPYEVRSPEDSEDVLDWVASRSWCNGRVVMSGGSYVAWTQLSALRSGSPVLVACSPSVMTLDPYSLYFSNGCRVDTFQPGWHRKFGGAKDYAEHARHPKRDEFWEKKTDFLKLDESKADVFYQGGWFDMIGLKTMETYNRLRKNGRRVFLRMGPWAHGVNTYADGGIDFKALGGSVTEDLEVDFLEKSLRGEKPQTDSLPGQILLYVMGRNEWRYETEWPLKGTKFVTWPFGKGKATFRHDPANPVPTCGGRMTPGGGIREQSAVEARADVLKFTGEELKEDLEVTGDVRAHIVFSSTSVTNDIAVKLVDVHPDGKAYGVVDSICRADDCVPGEMKTIDFPVDSTAYVFLKGHRIRIDVAGSSKPHYEVNPTAAEVTIDAADSNLVLPVIPEKR